MPTHGTGVYAMNSGKSFVAHGSIKKTRKVTPEQKARREYFKTHKTVVGEDAQGNITVRIEEI